VSSTFLYHVKFQHFGTPSLLYLSSLFFWLSVFSFLKFVYYINTLLFFPSSLRSPISYQYFAAPHDFKVLRNSPNPSHPFSSSPYNSTLTPCLLFYLSPTHPNLIQWNWPRNHHPLPPRRRLSPHGRHLPPSPRKGRLNNRLYPPHSPQTLHH
jgi:hypothetical protein